MYPRMVLHAVVACVPDAQLLVRMSLLCVTSLWVACTWEVCWFLIYSFVGGLHVLFYCSTCWQGSGVNGGAFSAEIGG